MNADSSLESVPGIGSTRSEKLREAGYETPAAVASASIDDLAELRSIHRDTARAIREAARHELGEDDTLATRLAGELGIDVADVASAYETLAPLSVPPEAAETPLRILLDDEITSTVLNLDVHSLRYRYLLFSNGYQALDDVAEASVTDLADVSYVTASLAEDFSEAAKREIGTDGASSGQTGGSAPSDGEATDSDGAATDSDGAASGSDEAAVRSDGRVGSSPTTGQVVADSPGPDVSAPTSPGADASSAAISTTPNAGEGTPDVDAAWRDVFPFETVYDAQTAGIDEFLDTLADNGWYAVEGACGTGKTLIALVASIYATRNDTVPVDGSVRSLPDFERAIAVTPVKQQLAQFVTEIRTINRNLPAGDDPATGLVLRGMTDLHAFTRADNLDFETALRQALDRAGDDGEAIADVAGFRQQVSSLRQTARHLVTAGSPVELDWDVEPAICDVDACRRYTRHTSSGRCPVHEDADDDVDGPWYDPVRAARIGELWSQESGDRLTVDGTTSPYPAEIPRVRDVVPFGEDPQGVSADAPFDPFYANAITGVPRVDFEDGPDHVLDGETLVREAVSEGYCPHTTMGELIGAADVLVGNYTHLFDRQTRQLTKAKGGAIDEDTIAIVDEAHMIEERTRDMLSERASVYTVRWARNDLELAADVAEGATMAPPEVSRRASDRAQDILESGDDGHDFDSDDLTEAAAFLEWALDTVEDLVDSYLREEYRDWTAAIGEGRPSNDSVALTGQTAGDVDSFTRRLAASRFDQSFVARLDALGEAAAEIHASTNVGDRETVVAEVCRLFGRWVREDDVEYFREIELEHAEDTAPGSGLPAWCERLTATLHLFNCIPDRQLGRIYDELGGGISMSATLEPIEEFTRATGLTALADGVDGGTGEAGTTSDAADGRRVTTATYGLSFPPENRASWTVTLPRFTYRNRGNPLSGGHGSEPVTDYDALNSVRQQYFDALTTVADSHGNVLVAMPNYGEARWAAAVLEQESAKAVFLDQSSRAEETTALLDEFFAADGGVLVTSALGTVTEGIDYDGDKLHAAVVVGVPFRNTQAPRTQATIDAYDERLAHGNLSGYDLAVGIPAVRKARQAIGRVLRSPDEVGVRIFLDERYAETGSYDVGQFLPRQVYEEFETVSPDMLQTALDRFWETN